MRARKWMLSVLFLPAFMLCGACSPKANAQVFIDYDTTLSAPLNATVTVQQNAIGRSPTVNIVAGADISHDVAVLDRSTVNIADGILRQNINGFANSTLNIQGGILDGISVRDNAVLNMSGGSNIGGGVSAFGSQSTVNISGGIVGPLSVFADSMATVSGGVFTGFFSNGTSVVDFFGTNLQLSNAQPLVEQGRFGPVFGTKYDLTGTLLDGSSINAQYLRFDDSRILFNGVTASVPEPSALAVLACSILTGIGLLRRSARTRALRGL